MVDKLKYKTRIKKYPDGSQQIMCSDHSIFVPENDKAKRTSKSPPEAYPYSIWEDYQARIKQQETPETPEQLKMDRAKRRAIAKVKDYALCSDFKWFVTLTLSKAKIDRYNEKECIRKLSKWLNNMVERHGLTYIVVAEEHKDGAIHFHGFFNDVLDAPYSGTMTFDGLKKPKRIAKGREQQYIDAGWRRVYNLPQWTLGWTTAIELYGERAKAVNYVVKYITKADRKIGGRWYYSGGALQTPLIELENQDITKVQQMDGAYKFDIDGVGAFVIVNIPVAERTN